MNTLNVVFIVLCVFGIGIGQILFKLAAREAADTLLNALLSPYLLIALAIYGLATITWVWQLSMVDLTRAYPFMALTFVVVPLLSMLLLNEAVGWSYFLGVACIVCGIVVIQASG
jgi:drug/metabolite transporter (DMT)-like permease